MQQSKGRVVLCGDNVTDDIGVYVVLTEPSMSGEANDAVSEYTQVNKRDALVVLR